MANNPADTDLALALNVNGSTGIEDPTEHNVHKEPLGGVLCLRKFTVFEICANRHRLTANLERRTRCAIQPRSR
jgi:hypothetical protein